MNGKLAKTISLGAAIVLLIFQLLMQIHLARLESQTTDEGIHLLAGYTYVTTGTFGFNSEHPPLVKILAGLPLLALNPTVPTNHPYWEKAKNYFYHGPNAQRDLGEAFLYQVGNDPEQLLFLGRMATVFLTLCLGLAIYAISVSFWGWWGGLISVLFYVFDPTLNGHGHYITTDIGVSLGILVATFAFWRYLIKPTLLQAVLLGLALGIAFLMKFTALVLIPIFAIIVVYKLFIDKKYKTVVAPAKLGAIIAMAWLVLIVIYGFNLQLPPQVASLQKTIETVNPLDWEQIIPKPDNPVQTTLYNSLRYIAVPRDFVKGVVLLLTHIQYGQEAFLLGQSSYNGWWYYFPILFLTKTPLVTMIAIGLSLFWAWKWRSKYPYTTLILTVAAGFLIFAMSSSVNIGIRHILPIYPLLFVGLGILALAPKRVGYLTTFLGLVLILGFARTYPHYLSYFNEAAGGSVNGYNIATDSNTEWGQDLKRIKTYIEKNNIDTPYIEYYWNGLSSLNYYGIKHRYLADFKPGDTGYIIVGASALQTTQFKWLKQYKPIDRITPSVLVYKL